MGQNSSLVHLTRMKNSKARQEQKRKKKNSARKGRIDTKNEKLHQKGENRKEKRKIALERQEQKRRNSARKARIEKKKEKQ